MLVEREIKPSEDIFALSRTVILERNIASRELEKYPGSSKVWKLTMADLQVLALLASVPTTGYSLKKRFSSKFGGKISFGSLYPRLRHFEKLEIVVSKSIDRTSGPWGIRYELTEKGKKELKKGINFFREKLLAINELTRDTLDSDKEDSFSLI